MKKMIMLAAVAACINAVAGVGATTNWVARYVADYVSNAISNSIAETSAKASSATTNDITTVSAGTGEYALTASWENATKLSLTATNCTAEAIAAGISDGECWAIGDGGDFRGVGVPDITKTPTNYVCAAFSSSGSSPMGFLSATGVAFSTTAVYVTPSEARAIRGEQ